MKNILDNYNSKKPRRVPDPGFQLTYDCTVLIVVVSVGNIRNEVTSTL